MTHTIERSSDGSAVTQVTALPAWLRLRWLVCGVTIGGVIAFVGLAAIDRPAAPLALCGALLVAAKGAGWLLVLRRNRKRLRRAGFRW